MGRPFVTIVLGTMCALAACGGGSGEGPGVPLLSTSLAGVYKGQPFTPAFGVATVYMADDLIALGDGPLNCGSTQRNEPPSGTNAIVYAPGLDLQTSSGVFVDIVQNKGGFSGAGSNSATLTITAVSAASVVGSISYSYTDDMNQTYGLSGDFEVSRCPM